MTAVSKSITAAATVLVCAICLAVPAAAQSIVISLEAWTDEVGADPHAFGVHEDALPAADVFDLPEPPNPPSDYLSLAFVIPGYGGPLANRWREEYKPTLSMEDEFEDWILHVETDRVDATATLRFEPVVGADLPLGVVVTPASGRPRRGSLPVQIDISLDAPHTEYVVTLLWDDPTPSERSAWGEVKRLYDR